jgi:TrmH family RNA methyltransferase
MYQCGKKLVILPSMISKNKAKFIISLQQKKIREEKQLFIIEGDKIVKEFLSARVPIHSLIAKPEFLSSLSIESTKHAEEILEASFDDLKKISTLKTPHNAIAVIRIKENKLNPADIFNKLCVALDCIQDPGNLGTIIRSAAWYGINNIICSDDSVDVYNPKVIQASMGAILNVNVYYYGLKEFLNTASDKNIPVFGTMLEGDSIYTHKLDNKGIILLGNESKGISEELIPYITNKIMIPRFTRTKPGIDSLNVSMAASIIFSEFLSRTID